MLAPLAQVVFKGSLAALAKHMAKSQPTSAIAKLLNACSRERTMSVTRCASLAARGAEVWKSYDTPPLVVSASMNPGEGSLRITRRRQLVSHTQDYDFRPVELDEYCEYTMTSMYVKMMGTGGLRYKLGHPQFATHSMHRRERMACPVMYGIPRPGTDRWPHFVRALFRVNRVGDGNVETLGAYEKRVVQNVSARLLAPRDRNKFRDADDDVEDAKCELVDAEMPSITPFNTSAVAATGTAVPAPVLGGACAAVPLWETDPGEQLGADEAMRSEMADDKMLKRPPVVPAVYVAALPDFDAREMLKSDAGVKLGPEQMEVATMILDYTLNAGTRAPLRLLAHGEAGTGKSKVIDAVVRVLRERDMEDTLLLTAYTGAAAQLLSSFGVDASTTSSAFALGYSGATATKTTWKVTEALQLRWAKIRTLVIDEASFVAVMHRKNVLERVDFAAKLQECRLPWNVVMLGDFFQHPPPGGATLYNNCSVVGLEHFAGWYFRTLRLNYRIVAGKDGQRLRDFLGRLRSGELREADIEALQERVAGTGDVPALEAMGDYQVLTLRHEVIDRLVVSLVQRQAMRDGKQLVMWRARDTAHAMGPADKRACGLQPVGFFYEGMRAISSYTVSAKYGFVNNSPVELVGIQLNAGEPPLPAPSVSPVVWLDRMPARVYAKVPGKTFKIASGNFEEGVVSVKPVKLKGPEGKNRLQLPYRPAVVITDFCAQGATFDSTRRVVVDLTRPPSGPFTFHSLYVTLSRFRRWSDVVLLRSILNKCEALREMDIAFFLRHALPPKDVVAAAWLIEHPDKSVDDRDLLRVLAQLERRVGIAKRRFRASVKACSTAR